VEAVAYAADQERCEADESRPFEERTIFFFIVVE
jgi:hypothetical protein